MTAAVTQELARRFKVIPIAREARRLTLAMKNPLDIFAIDEIRLITGKEVEPVIATEEDIINAISANYRTEVNVSEAVSDVMQDLDEASIQITAENAATTRTSPSSSSRSCPARPRSSGCRT